MWINEAEYYGQPYNDDDENGYEDDIWGWDFNTNGKGAQDNDPNDVRAHGTHVAGTVGAVGDNGKGVVGVCWDVSIMNLKIDCGYSDPNDPNGGIDAYLDAAIEAIEYADENGASVLNCSWRVKVPSGALYESINGADANGILVVACAGNDNSDIDSYPVFPACYDSNNIIAVLATDDNDNEWYRSNYGTNSVDLGAPGVDILSCVCYVEPPNNYGLNSGTSMATPHVSGACALVWAVRPSLSHHEVRQIILDSVDDVGLYEFCATGGRLNLFRALSLAAFGPLHDAMDTNLIFTTGGDADWFYQTSEYYYDGDAAESGNIDDDEETWLQTTVDGPGIVSFYWKVSSESSWDYLEFYIDDSLEEEISGQVDWDYQEFQVNGSGPHTLKWKYDKDESISRYEDCGWVDKVEWIECFPDDHPDYEEWVSVGRPECWCYPRQCHGDTDNAYQGKNHYWVSANDLDLLVAAWNKPLEELSGNEICADFDHATQDQNEYRVSTDDLEILVENWQIPDGPDPNCFSGYRGQQAGGESFVKHHTLEEILKWLEEVWLDPEVHEAINEDEWLRFIESIINEWKSE
jgi:hypothetical protein